MPRDNAQPTGISGHFHSTGGGTATLNTILELAEQLDSAQLDELAARLGKLRLNRHGNDSADETRQLTEREKEVLVLVASGYNRKEIGRALRISACTAAKHISNIYRKLGVSTIAEATRVALVQNDTLLN